jgi:hypothetical protein
MTYQGDRLMTTATGLPAGVVTYIGGPMYGDGEYVVEFQNVRSALAPLKAIVLGPGSLRSVEFEDGTEPNVQTARRVIALARMGAR